jgi:hypothetical protein
VASGNFDRLITAKNIKAQSVDQFHRYVDLFLTAEATRQWGLEVEGIRGTGHRCARAGLFGKALRAVREAHGGDTVRKEETYWQSRYPSIPPILQVRDSGFRPIREPVTRHTNVRIAGQELDGLRTSTREARHTEFQWVLASYALSVFGLTSQDRLKFSVTVNMRNRAQEGAVGMFALRVPVLLERRPSHADMLSHVHQEVLKSLLAYRRMDPHLLDQSMDRFSEPVRGRGSDDLTVD